MLALDWKRRSSIAPSRCKRCGHSTGRSGRWTVSTSWLRRLVWGVRPCISFSEGAGRTRLPGVDWRNTSFANSVKATQPAPLSAAAAACPNVAADLGRSCSACSEPKGESPNDSARLARPDAPREGRWRQTSRRSLASFRHRSPTARHPGGAPGHLPVRAPDLADLSVSRPRSRSRCRSAPSSRRRRARVRAGAAPRVQLGGELGVRRDAGRANPGR